MRTIHQRSHAHKQRFALLTSGGITLMIFGIWSLVVFGGRTAQVAEAPVVEVKAVDAESPFEGLKGGVANSFNAVKEQAEKIKETIANVNVETKYQEVRNEALAQ